MPRFKNMVKKVGYSPGTLIPRDDKKAIEVKYNLFNYDREHLEERELSSMAEAVEFESKSTVTWLNIEGMPAAENLLKIGDDFGIHPLVIEDIYNTAQRPKIESYGHYIYIVVKMLVYNDTNKTIESEQISIILYRDYVLLVQEKSGDVFNMIRDRIRQQESRLRNNGADYLAYRLLDTIVDHYFIILERLSEAIEDLEVELLREPDEETLEEIHRLKRELIGLRRSVWPLREVVNTLIREETKLVTESTQLFFRDVYDHVMQVIDTLENFREMVSGMLDIYLSSISNRMNEVMKVLTMMATIFIPLTFIAGIYGMNFETMPELGWRWGYPAVWAVMIIAGIAMTIYFRKKKWL